MELKKRVTEKFQKWAAENKKDGSRGRSKKMEKRKRGA